MHKWETTSFSELYWPFSFLIILLKTQLNGFLKGVPFQMWGHRFQSPADTNPKYNIILFERDCLPQRHTNEHSKPAGMSLQVTTENCFIAQKGQEYNKSFWWSLIFFTFTTLAINLIWSCKAYLTQRLVLNAPSCMSVWELWYFRDHFNNLTEMILHLLSSRDH